MTPASLLKKFDSNLSGSLTATRSLEPCIKGILAGPPPKATPQEIGPYDQGLLTIGFP